MKQTEYSITAKIGGKPWQLACGQFAMQANGCVTARVGDTVVMATVVLGQKPREGIDYLPLLVDYEEKLYAAGKIKGSRWVKREGRPSDAAILAGRVIDRSLRPMFNSDIRNDIQVVVTVLSVDGENDPDIIGLVAASAAIEISDIPWQGPIAGMRVGKVNGEFVINPSFTVTEEKSVLDLIVSGTGDYVIMVEAGASEVSEEDLLSGVALAQREIRKAIAAIRELASKVKQPKKELVIFAANPEILSKVESCAEELRVAVFQVDRAAREEAMRALRERLVTEIASEDEELEKHVDYAFDKLLKRLIQEAILREDKRPDGRALNEIRPISCKVAVLPRVHGSGLFQRGDTQVLTTVTLGSPGEEQILEDIETEQERKKRYIHHYNMPGYASGEVAPLRSPGRREVGHGALAERALLPMIPKKEDFPYTLRLVSEVLSSNGSTSMAATCGSTLALMDAGILIKAPVSGIAMGLVLDEGGNQSDKGNEGYKILTDILGIEDGNGHMDFKVAGTKNGITALQLDIKVTGLTAEILREALTQAKIGRMFILEKMLEIIPKPRESLSPYAPRIISFKINPEKIREVIGPGGKVINEIIAETGVKIDIEDDGLVMVTSVSEEASQKAVEWIKNLTREVKVGEIFKGKITRVLDFGAFVEILPGQEGLIHISELVPYHVERVSDIVKVGDIVPVKVTSIDELGRINLSRKALLDEGNNQNRRNFDNDHRPNRSRYLAKRK